MHRWILALLAFLCAVGASEMSERKIVTVAEVDYDFCTWRYGEGDANTALHAWELNGDATDSAGDSDGTEEGSPTYAAGKFGQAVFTDADASPSSYIDTNFTPTKEEIAEGISLIFWHYNDSSESFQGYVGGGDIGGSSVVVGLKISPFGDFDIIWNGNTWQGDITGFQDAWNLYVLTYDGHTVRSYFEGDLVRSEDVGDILESGFSEMQTTLAIGADQSGQFPNVGGGYDRVRWYPFVLQDNQIATMASDGKGPGCTAVLGTDGDAKCFNTRETCQDLDNYNRAAKPLRFYMPSGDLISPTTRAKMDALPSIASVSTAPARIRPGEDLGERASVSVQFRDHPYHDRTVDKYALERISGDAQADSSGYNPAERGTYWGKWRARNPYFQNRPLRIIQGTSEQLDADPVSLTEMETRHYVMESIEGPTSGGSFTITAKDVLKLADDDRAQAPAASQGVLDADITDSATSATLSPSGIGDSEYPASGHVTIENEIMEFTRSGDTLTLTRAQYGTAAEAHGEGDTVQLAIEYDGEKASAIVEDLLVNYANVSSAFIDSTAWTNEDDTHINRLYTAIIVEPESVRELIGQLCEQVGFTIWWDEINQLIEFRAIRQPGTPPMTLTDAEHFLQGSMKVKEQQKKRISQVWVYYGVIDPTEDLEEARNYRSVYVDIDTDAQSDNEYQKPKIKKVFARWIDRFNQAAAEDMAARILSRYRDAPRKFDFSLKWDQAGVSLGNTYDARTRLMQQFDGQADDRRIIVLSYERGEDRVNVESEEFLFTPDPDDTTHRVIVDADTTQMADGSPFNLRTAHDRIYTDVDGSDTVELIVTDNAILGSNSPDDPACDIGDWPSGTTVKVICNGRIQGAGGKAGRGGSSDEASFDGDDGQDGGIALYTRRAIELDNQGEIWGGAGGGGGGGAAVDDSGGDRISFDGSGGGGGSGFSAGAGAPAGGDFAGNAGDDGTTESGGGGGVTTDTVFAGDGGDGGDGGDPGQSGANGEAGTGNVNAGAGGTGGTAGAAIDGDSFVTYTTTGDIRGSQVN